MSEAIMKHHLDAFGKRDVEEILKDYTEDSTIITPDAVIKGLDAIRMQYEIVTKTLLPAGAEFVVTKNVADDNVGYLIWHAESEYFKVPFATDTFVFEGGKIKTHTIAFVMEGKHHAD